MRIKILLIVNKLPILYRHKIISFIKESLKISNIDYKESLYSGINAKPFTFSLLMPANRTVRKGIIQIDKDFIIEDNIFTFDKDSYLSLFISSYDYKFLLNLYNGIRKLKTFHFSSDDNMLVDNDKIDIMVDKISVLNEKNTNNNEVVFKTNSPVIINDKDNKPISFENLNLFNENINIIENKIFKSIIGRDLKKPLEFIPINIKKQVAKHTLSEFREKTHKPIMYLNGIEGIFELKGDVDDLNILYQKGLGLRTSQGFGMLEVI